MTLSSAMQVGFTGIQSNSVTVDTVGDNLANANTTAFKSQRTLFETLMYRTIHEGSGPTANSGGTLPRQTGYGSGVSAIQRNFKNGSVEGTGFPSDLAVDGTGFFIVTDSNGENVYTRDGAFGLDGSNTMINPAGRPLQVFQADAEGNIGTTLGSLVVPIGASSDPVATTLAALDGQLNADGSVATAGEVLTSEPITTSTGAAATAGTPLTSVTDEDGISLFNSGDVITVNADKGDVSIPEATFTVGTDGTSLGDFATFLETTLGINTDAAIGDGAGVAIENGSLVVRSNIGTSNAVSLDGTAIFNTTTPVGAPFLFSTTTAAAGENIQTSFNVFDSLGNPVEVRLRMAMESKTDAGTTWRYFAESTGDTDLSPIIGTGTVSFDQTGRFLAATGSSLSIDRSNVGSATPLVFDLDFNGLTAYAGSEGSSQVIFESQDGRPSGILVDYRVETDGTVIATYTNEQEEVLGQVALATFANEEGLVAISENLYKQGDASGDPSIVAPETGIAGFVVQGALEKSNVEIAREFINLISAQTGVSSASRVVRVADEMLQQLLTLVR